jgi:hypothetical protein
VRSSSPSASLRSVMPCPTPLTPTMLPCSSRRTAMQKLRIVILRFGTLIANGYFPRHDRAIYNRAEGFWIRPSFKEHSVPNLRV